jgi:NAD/NADP transhydrogenase beta subunit
MLFIRAVRILTRICYSKNGVISSRVGLVTSPSGSILPEPKKPRFGYLGVICAVATGIFIGATISKNVAHFLEENDLFVPSDDDDDD